MVEIRCADPDGEFAEVSAEALHRGLVDYLDEVTQHSRMLVAEQYRTLAEILREAPGEADLWVGPDPSRDPEWQPPQGMTVARWRRERAEFAVRSAAADVAVRLHLGENTVRTRAARVEALRERCPRLWSRFLGGMVAEQNAMAAAQLAQSLPGDAASWEAFDEGVAEAATRLTPAGFRVRARIVRERVHAESVDARHRRAARDRGVWLTPECDGMATLTAVLPAVTAHAILERLDEGAHDLRSADDEDRTLDQLRADVLADLVGGVGPGEAVRATIAVTVPMLTLLGVSDEPASLDGYGPIDLETARRLAGGATSWIRLLTEPVSSTVLDVDRRSYRPPADLRRWVERMHPTCAFAGCRRPSRHCDLDHMDPWSEGGGTSAGNLQPLCPSHHRVRHGTAWRIIDDPGPPTARRAAGPTRWRSPTGHECLSDPPF